MGNKLMLPLEVIAFSKDAICMLKKTIRKTLDIRSQDKHA